MKLDHLITPDPAISGWGFMPPTEEVFNMFEWVKQVAQPTYGLEIGFHVGHSTTYQMEIFGPDFRMRSHGQSQQFEKQAAKMMHIYPNLRVSYRPSWELYGMYAGREKFDYALVDGSHKPYMAANDVLHCIMLGIPWILVDNAEQFQVRDDMKLFDSIVDLSKTFEYTATHNGVTKVNQANLYHVRTNSIQQLIRQQNNQADRFQVLP